MPDNLVVSFEVVSVDPNKTIMGIVAEIERAVPELEAYLKTRETVEKLSVSRRGTYPIGTAEAMLLHFVITLSGAVVVGAAEKLGGDIYAWLKEKIPGLRLQKKGAEPTASEQSQRK